MKKLMFCWVLSFLFLSTAYAQYGTTRTGYDGDFFSLEGALELFKQSHTLRDFERRLNTEDDWVNNLDLDYDGRIDYIRVEHQRQGDFHAIILQALVGRSDVQDVAVIEIEMIGRRQAILQIVGDEGLYGEEVIVEPAEGYTDSRTGYHSNYGSYVNVYYWNPVQYILGRQYVVYASPYRWQYYPSWWRPWTPCAWSIFRPRIVIYHRYYHVVHVHRVIRVHHFYRTHRSYSYSVVQRTNAVRAKQGKPPIHRPGPALQQERKSNGHSSRKSYEQQRSSTTRPSTPGQSPAVSRKRTEPSRQKAARNTSPQANPKSRNSTDRPGTIRSTTLTNQPAAKSRKSTSSYEEKAAKRSTAPQAKQPSRRTPSSSGSSVRSTSPSRKSSGSSRTAPSNQTKAKRNTPSNVRQQSSRTTPRSSTVTRSKTSSRKPSASSRKSTPSVKPKASPGKSSNSKGSSRSRGGG